VLDLAERGILRPKPAFGVTDRMLRRTFRKRSFDPSAALLRRRRSALRHIQDLNRAGNERVLLTLLSRCDRERARSERAESCHMLQMRRDRPAGRKAAIRAQYPWKRSRAAGQRTKPPFGFDILLSAPTLRKLGQVSPQPRPDSDTRRNPRELPRQLLKASGGGSDLPF
jgi:hypothetical protein